MVSMDDEHDSVERSADDQSPTSSQRRPRPKAILSCLRAVILPVIVSLFMRPTVYEASMAGEGRVYRGGYRHELALWRWASSPI